MLRKIKTPRLLGTGTALNSSNQLITVADNRLSHAARQYFCSRCGSLLGDGSIAFKDRFTCADCVLYFAQVDADLRGYHEGRRRAA